MRREFQEGGSDSLEKSISTIIEACSEIGSSSNNNEGQNIFSRRELAVVRNYELIFVLKSGSNIHS